jgi:hypothetical protein
MIVETIITLVTLLGGLNLPLNFTAEQREITTEIIKQANLLGEDPYGLVAIAYQETKIRRNQTSDTGDIGIFQIHWKFWGRRWGYKSRKVFRKDMDNPTHGTVAAIMVLREMRLYKTCRGTHLYACYNGGPAWMKSKNIKKIKSYARRVEKYRRRFLRNHPGWRKLQR